jgi:hypothetical protein
MRRVEGSHDNVRWIYLGTIPDDIPENEELKYIQEQGFTKCCKYVRIIKIS